MGHWPQGQGDIMESYDYIVIGAGTAGCLMANRLSANPKNRVLLLEAGGSDNYHWIHIPVGYLYCISNPRTDWMFKTEAEPGLNGRSLAYPRGKVLGGCSSINGMIYMRGQAQDYDTWRQLGCTGWGWEDVMPLFKKHEDFYRGTNDLHGSGAEWRVEKARVRWDVLDAFLDAAEQAGIPRTEDFNQGSNEGAGYFDVNQRSGVRWNSAKAFLHPIKSRSNLRVMTQAHVKQIILADGEAKGVVIDHKGNEIKAFARAEVVLCAGAIGSPHILERSGIGRGDILQKAGITPLVDAPEVGENLQDHLQLRLIYKVSGVATLNEKASSLWGKAMIGMEYALRRSGPMAMAPSQAGIFTRSRPDLATPDLQYHVQPVSLDKFGEPVHPFPAMTASVCNLRPQSRGSSHAISDDYRAAPMIRPNYLSEEADLSTAARAIELTRKIAAQPAFAKFSPQEYRPGPEYETQADLRRAAAEIGTTIFHPVGTCRMGADDRSVVDPELKLRGLGRLRIADASIMPRIVSGNTNSPSLMIAEKAATMILATH